MILGMMHYKILVSPFNYQYHKFVSQLILWVFCQFASNIANLSHFIENWQVIHWATHILQVGMNKTSLTGNSVIAIRNSTSWHGLLIRSRFQHFNPFSIAKYRGIPSHCAIIHNYSATEDCINCYIQCYGQQADTLVVCWKWHRFFLGGKHVENGLMFSTELSYWLCIEDGIDFFLRVFTCWKWFDVQHKTFIYFICK